MTETAQQLVARLTGFTPGPWHRGQTGNTRIYGPDGQGENSGMLADVKYKAVTANAALIAAAPDLHRIAGEQAVEIARLRSILGRYADHAREQEGSDSLESVWKGSPISEAEAQEISGLCPSTASRKVKP